MSHRQNRIFVLTDGLHNPAGGHGHAVEGGSLQLNHGASRIFGPLRNPGVIQVPALLGLVERIHRLSGHSGAGPHRHLAVAVLAQNIGGDIGHIHTAGLPNHLAEPGRVQGRAGTDDPVGGKSGLLLHHIGEHIYRIGHHHQNGIDSILHNPAGNVPGNGNIGFGQVQPGLAGLPGHSGSEDDDLGIGAVFVAAVADLYLVKKGGTVDNIQGAALGPVTVDVHQHNLAGLSADHQGIANRFPHIAGSNDDDFTFVRDAHKAGLPFRVGLRLERRGNRYKSIN